MDRWFNYFFSEWFQYFRRGIWKLNSNGMRVILYHKEKDICCLDCEWLMVQGIDETILLLFFLNISKVSLWRVLHWGLGRKDGCAEREGKWGILGIKISWWMGPSLTGPAWVLGTWNGLPLLQHNPPSLVLTPLNHQHVLHRSWKLRIPLWLHNKIMFIKKTQ